jgi:hypothetical protein
MMPFTPTTAQLELLAEPQTARMPMAVMVARLAPYRDYVERVPTTAEILRACKIEDQKEFVRLHKTLRMTPAMAANVSSQLWSLEELVDRTSK